METRICSDVHGLHPYISRTIILFFDHDLDHNFFSISKPKMVFTLVGKTEGYKMLMDIIECTPLGVKLILPIRDLNISTT
jgi:hypothetical protein